MAQHEKTVHWFNNSKGYHFLGSDDGPETFAGFSSVQSEGYKSVKEGQSPQLNGVQGEKRPQRGQAAALKLKR